MLRLRRKVDLFPEGTAPDRRVRFDALSPAPLETDEVATIMWRDAALMMRQRQLTTSPCSESPSPVLDDSAIEQDVFPEDSVAEPTALARVGQAVMSKNPRQSLAQKRKSEENDMSGRSDKSTAPLTFFSAENNAQREGVSGLSKTLARQPSISDEIDESDEMDALTQRFAKIFTT